MNLQGIKNIIFDLGVVILNVDYQLTIDAFCELGAEYLDKHYTNLKQDKFFDDFETGKITAHEFRNIIRKKLQINITDKEIDEAWNKMLIELPSERLILLKKLKKQYRLFCLSNTNEIHLEAFKNLIRDQHGLDSFKDYFDKEYYSNLIGYKKPDPHVYKLILKENQLKPAETLFIDDVLQHVQGAEKTGLISCHLAEDQTILDIFN